MRRFTYFSLLVTLIATCSVGYASDDVPLTASGQPTWASRAVQEAERLRDHRMNTNDSGSGVGSSSAYAAFGAAAGATTVDEAVPATLNPITTTNNALGIAATYTPAAPLTPSNNPFFQPLGSNQRTCQSCHQPDAGWSITPKNITALFKSSPDAPLFRTVDGAVCGNANTDTASAAKAAYSLLLSKGLIRVFIPLPTPPTLQFSIIHVDDPYHCTSDPVQGISSPTKGIVSVYRRPLPSTNIPFLTSFMWDGREATLESQATDAVAIHAQGTTVPSGAQLQQIVAFESGLFSSQVLASTVGTLTDDGAEGGPLKLSATQFYVGINDVLGADPQRQPFNPVAMTLFTTWNLDSNARRAAVARGQNLFNEKPITITGVTGLNDQPGLSTVAGTCTTCHDTPNIGNHSTKLPINIGVTAPVASGLDTAGLPVFTLHCDTGPLAGQVTQTTDPGKALISGQCADIGKMKGPILRNLSARPPYFHNGSAPDLPSVIRFYNTRFNIGLTDAEQADLVMFLTAL